MRPVMRELVAEDPTLLLHDRTDLPFAPGDLDEEAYADMVVLSFGEASGWRGAS